MPDPGKPRHGTAPERLGRYRVDAVLGRGAMGTVYRGHDERIDRPVALKTVREELLAGSGGADFLERFRREVQAAGRCSHPNIVAVYDYSDAPPTPYIVMELLEGASLAAHVAGPRRIPPAEALPVIGQLLNALHFAHSLDIVHRDVKPANVMLLPDGRVKVADFGVARLGEAAGAATLVGTPHYMSPEQWHGGPVDARSDIYSAAAVLFEMLAGERPPPAGAGASAPGEHPRIPKGWQESLNRALAPDPAQRFPSAREFSEALFENAPEEAAAGPADATVVRPAGLEAPPAPSPGGWDPQILLRAEQELTQYIGPIARVLVRRRAAEAASLDELCRSLARNIPEPREQERFLRRASGASTTLGRTTTAGSAPGASTLPEAELEAARRHLAQFVGPIARVLVNRAARRAHTLPDLYLSLADSVPAGDRERFLAGQPAPDA